eukprot:2032806-Prymnesium_polylepis.1
MSASDPDGAVLSSLQSNTHVDLTQELTRRRYRPRVLIGLTSSAQSVPLQNCLQQADGCAAVHAMPSISSLSHKLPQVGFWQAQGIIIPTSFAPINSKAREVSTLALQYGGAADLHSAAGWEILHILRDVIANPANQILAQPTSVVAGAHLLRRDASLSDVQCRRVLKLDPFRRSIQCSYRSGELEFDGKPRPSTRL